ncbi:short-chain fatty acyl-CoA regulator family protein [Pseudomonas sp. BF-R-01]|uniref:short-chain fatty acyl-CoA regulator family protein n=1 Tax=Pseudomonas sp. BF-R-01 TaxID=2832365 RepID=UPI001CBC682E|nr:short-chain fatty acyl-CoA regulator family protein [Pseudomonas sp. BF-R-01]
MRKTFMGIRLRTLREQRGLSQAAMAEVLQLSPSYLSQLEHDQRPLTVAVLLRLKQVFDMDVQLFSESDEMRLSAELRETLATLPGAGNIADTEIQALAQQMPAIGQALLQLHRRCQSAEERLGELAHDADNDHVASGSMVPPYEEVRDYFYGRRNHVAELDALAESLHHDWRLDSLCADSSLDLTTRIATGLNQRLATAHGVRVLPVPDHSAEGNEALRDYDPQTRTLRVPARLPARRLAFHLATQLAFLEAGDLIHQLADDGNFSNDDARALGRMGLAGYFAGALLLPYTTFLNAAEALHYDVELLAQRFDVSFETVCHRLSTLQRPDQCGIPFFFVRVDRAGNVSKSQSATDFHFSRTGGTCPLWNVYEAFSQPRRTLTQVAQTPDGRSYLWIARSVLQQSGGYNAPTRSFAIGLGCDLRHAARTVYAKGLSLDDPNAATKIGPGCKVCDRKDCIQRAFPPLGQKLRVNENLRYVVPYKQ